MRREGRGERVVVMIGNGVGIGHGNGNGDFNLDGMKKV